VIVAIDGPAGAGKSTVARAVAARLGAGYLDTGAMYRAVALLALREGIAPSDDARLAAAARSHPLRLRPEPGGMGIEVDGRDVSDEIRTAEVTGSVSEVSAHPGVREAITALQRQVLADGSWVCDGRDIGTTVWPSAELKVFLTASVSERARRRCAELAARGTPEPLDAVAAGIEERDRRDSTRATSPLRAAEDAVHLDTSDLTVAQVVDTICSWAEARAGAGS
jgi:CMP/dCMP kinase